MSVVKILIKENGVYVEDPKLDRDFIEKLKDILQNMGVYEVEDSDIVKIFREAKSSVVQILSELPENHDAGITFKKSEDDQSQIIATIIPPHGNGDPLTKKDVNERLEIEGLSGLRIFEDILIEALNKQKNETEPYSFIIGEFPPPLIKVDVSSDEMSATITIKKFQESQKITVDDVYNALEKANVVKGILNERIKEIVDTNLPVESELIAKGQNPIDGENGEIIYNFDVKKEHRGPQINTEGKADFHNLNLFENVRIGDLLCQLIPPTKGQAGFKVTGSEIPAKAGREAIMPQGQNTEIDPNDPSRLIASIDGSPKLCGGKVIVEPVMNIRSDIGVATGDIDFVGSIHISGGINDGYTVKAKGDITINGPCESASIISGGNVILQKGMRSNESGFIQANGDVHAAFLEGVTVYAKGNVIIRDYCFHCNIKSEKSVKVLGKRGFITGGRVEAKEYIIARRLGSQAFPRTEVLIDSFLKSDSNIDLEINKLIEEEMQKSRQIEEQPIIEQDNPRDQISEPQEQQYVAVVDNVYPNVFIMIKDGKILTSEELIGVKFVNKFGRIEMIPYEYVEDNE